MIIWTVKLFTALFPVICICLFTPIPPPLHSHTVCTCSVRACLYMFVHMFRCHIFMDIFLSILWCLNKNKTKPQPIFSFSLQFMPPGNQVGWKGLWMVEQDWYQRTMWSFYSPGLGKTLELDDNWTEVDQNWTVEAYNRLHKTELIIRPYTILDWTIVDETTLDQELILDQAEPYGMDMTQERSRAWI